MPIPQDTKTCKTCGVEKPGTPDFWYITPKGVPYPNCKVCHMAITKQYKVDTRNAIREWRKEHPHGQLDAGQVRVLVEDYRAACRQREELKAQSSYRRRK